MTHLSLRSSNFRCDFSFGIHSSFRFFVLGQNKFDEKSEIARIFTNFTRSAVDYRDRGMKIRLNVGVEWGKLLKTKKKVHKGYRPMRRVVQVIKMRPLTK